MCGRYAATKDPATLMREFEATDGTEGQAPTANYNVAPTKNIVTIVDRHPRDDDGNVQEDEPVVRSLRVMRWGLVPFWAKDPAIGNRMINTRAETAKEKPSFRKALSRRRCLIPADGWFEWRVRALAEGREGTDGAGKSKKPPKDPFFMTTRDGSSLAFAGLWETWRDPKADEDADQAPLITCSILTTDAQGQLAEVHDRMPLVMPKDRWRAWLDPDSKDVAELMEPPGIAWADSLELRPVSTLVNSVRNNGPDLLNRVEPEAIELDGALFDRPEISKQ